MKKIFLSLTALTVLFLIGCEQRTDISLPTASTAAPSLGTANFTSFVSLGNSITAGFQSNALYKSASENSFGRMIAKQVGASYEFPSVSDSGIGGRIRLVKIDLSTSPSVPYLVYGAKRSEIPANAATLARPYNNLGVPGAILRDLIDTNDAFVDNRWTVSNPIFQAILRNKAFGKTELDQAKKLNPTFMTLWIGNNDVLGYATSGGLLPLTDVSTFTTQYNTLVSRITTELPNCKVAVANIPNVDGIPFFTTVGPSIGKSLASKGVTTGFFYATSSAYGMATNGALDSLKVIVTLPGSTAAAYLGSTGAYYRATVTAVPAGVDTTKPFGLHPANPFPNSLVLDPTEIQNIRTAVDGFNSAIAAAVAGKANFAFVDVNALFKTIRANDSKGGTNYNGLIFRTSFISGFLFSFDGVHPSNQGHAIIANEFIKAINSKFGAAIPLINVAQVTPGFNLSKQLPMNELGLPVFPKGMFDNLLF